MVRSITKFLKREKIRTSSTVTGIRVSNGAGLDCLNSVAILTCVLVVVAVMERVF